MKLANMKRRFFSSTASKSAKQPRLEKEAETDPLMVPHSSTSFKKTRPEHSYFEGHFCDVPPTNQWDKLMANMSTTRKNVFELMTVRHGDIRARHMFKSYATLCEEKYRHFTQHPFSLHPFSFFRFSLETATIINLFLITVIQTYFFCDPGETSQLILKVCELFYIVHMFFNFFTGYVEGNSERWIVLSLRKTSLKYLKTWFINDVLSVLTIFIKYDQYYTDGIILILYNIPKIFRFFILHKYMTNVVVVTIRSGTYSSTSLELITFLIFYLFWNVITQLSLEYFVHGSYYPDTYNKDSFLTIGDLWNASMATTFIFAMDRAVSTLRQNSNMNIMGSHGFTEYVFLIYCILAKICIIHCTMKYLICLFGSESARARYYIMSRQVSYYLNQRRYPPQIKKKIMKFYAIRFQLHFFLEPSMLACMSGPLKEDILMYTGRKLVSNVEFLKNLPRSLLLQIGNKLKIAIFIGGDIIFKINTIGDCLYFIEKGTVAVYSESGKEVCHLEDGDFFGEIALVMKHRNRTASVVAVTNCELFKLSREDFESSIACYPTLYENIKKVAISRFERTCVIDELHKSEMGTIVMDRVEGNL